MEILFEEMFVLGSNLFGFGFGFFVFLFFCLLFIHSFPFFPLNAPTFSSLAGEGVGRWSGFTSFGALSLSPYFSCCSCLLSCVMVTLV